MLAMLFSAVALCQSRNSEFEAFRSSLLPWHFPGQAGNRFPIVANNVLKQLRNPESGALSFPGSDTMYYYFRKATSANFTIVLLNLTPSIPGVEQDAYYENVLSAVEKLNRSQGDKKLRLMASDQRISRPYMFGFPSLAERLYSSAVFYGMSVDEPRENSFSHLATWSQYFNSPQSRPWVRDKLLYVNLFGVPAEKNYVTYVQRWIEIGRPQVLSFDHYAVWDDAKAAHFGDDIGADWGRDYFFNLEVFRQASLQTELPFWVWILVHRHWSTYSKQYYRRATEADIRFQVYSALAYGAKGILYYNFWNPPLNENPNGWHEEEAILDSNGMETDLFRPIAAINREISRLGEVLLNLRSVGVFHVTNNYPQVGGVGRKMSLEEVYSPEGVSERGRYGIKLVSWEDPTRLSAAEIKYKIVKNLNNEAGMVGILRGKDQEQLYLVVANKNRYSNETFFLTLDQQKTGARPRNVVLRNVLTSEVIEGKTDSNGDLQFPVHLQPGDGVLLKVE
jgi:hypothetical protein